MAACTVIHRQSDDEVQLHYASDAKDSLPNNVSVCAEIDESYSKHDPAESIDLIKGPR